MRPTEIPESQILQFFCYKINNLVSRQALTLDRNIPEKVSVLRLDTDWYESTKKELEVLYPKLSMGGALIVDDYGHWTGCNRSAPPFRNAAAWGHCVGR